MRPLRRAFLRRNNFRVPALRASQGHLGKEPSLGKAEQRKEMAYRILRTDAKERSLGDADQHGTEGDRPFAPEQLPEDKRLEKTEPFLGGDIPAQPENNMLRADSGRAVGRTGLAVETFVDGIFYPLGDLQIAGDYFFRQFVFAPGNIQLIAHFFKYRTDRAAFAALHAFLKFFGGFKQMGFGLLFYIGVHIHILLFPLLRRLLLGHIEHLAGIEQIEGIKGLLDVLQQSDPFSTDLIL